MASSIEKIVRSTVGKGVGMVAEFNRKRLPERTSPHPFLTGIHEPMRDELSLTDLEVTGTIPPVFNGRYLRIGPNPVEADPASYHWFTGDGMVHGIALKDGKAQWYRNRWIRSGAIGKALEVEPAPGPRHGGFDTVNTNIVDIGGRTWALVEAGSYPVELSENLEQQAYNPFDGTLKGSFTAHPHRDPETGEHHAIAYEASDPTTVRYIVLSADGRAKREQPITVQHGPSIHDCAFTARYAVILDLPVTFSMKALIGGHSFPYRWNPDHAARVGLLPRDGGGDDVIWCDVDPSYVFHIANAFDAEDGTVVIDVVAYDTMFDSDLPPGPDSAGRGLERWTVDPVRKTVARRTIDPSPQEFPRIDDRRIGQSYRYAYAMELSDREFEISGTGLYKHDLQTGERTTHSFGAGRHPGEFVFVPAHDKAAEDEGYLIGLVIDQPNDRTDLIILNARDIAGDAVASIRIPHRVPPGFHGNWLPG